MLISYSISIRSHGMAEGLSVGEQELKDYKVGIGYGESGINFGPIEGTYETFVKEYGYLSALFSLLLLSVLFIQIKDQFFMKEFWAALWMHLLCVFLAVLILLKLYELIFIKSPAAIEQSFFDVPRNFFAKATITYDWILVVLVAIVTVLHFVSFIVNVNNGKEHNNNEARN